MSVNSKMTAIADKIRILLGMTGVMGLDAMANNLTTANSEVGTQENLLAQIASELEGKSSPTVVQATPSISVSESGLITATATQTEGYVEAGTKSATRQLSTQAEKTITPGKSSQTAVAKGVYTIGDVTVAAIPETFQDVTVPLEDLNAANGGTAATTIDAAVDNTEELSDTQESLIAQIAAALAGKGAGGSSAPVIGTVSVKPSSNSTSISFTGLKGEPKVFAICPTGNITLGTTRYVTGVIFDGTTMHGTYGYRSGSSATSYYSGAYFAKTYSNGTLTITASSSTNGGNFTSSTTYQLVYVA